MISYTDMRASILSLLLCAAACGGRSSLPGSGLAGPDRGAVDAVPDGSLTGGSWALTMGGPGLDVGSAVGTDSTGHIYVAGTFSQTAVAGDRKLVSRGGDDVLVARIDRAGKVLWAVSGGGKLSDQGQGLAADSAGNVWVVGIFGERATFGSVTLTSSGKADIFVVRLDKNGNVQWASSAGGTAGEPRCAVGVDAAGHAIIAGTFSGNMTFGSTTLVSAGQEDVFVARLDPTGRVLWAISAGGSAPDAGYGVAVSPAGGSIVTGAFGGKASFGGIPLTARGQEDVFVARLDPAGKVLWAIPAGGPLRDVGQAVATDSAGTSFVTGIFAGQATFGTSQLTSAGQADAFVARLDAAGKVLWATSAGGPSDGDLGYGVALDSTGTGTVAGSFQGQATLGGTTLAAAGSYDVLVARFDPTGKLLGARAGGGASEDVGRAVALDQSGGLTVVGLFSDKATLGQTSVSSRGLQDAFVWRLDHLP